MTIQAMNAVFDEFAGSPTETLVLLALADRANGAWTCWPSIADISRRTNLSRQSVKNALKQLEARGVLVCDRFAGVKGSHGGCPTNRYTIVRRTLADRPPADPSDRPPADPSGFPTDKWEHPNGQMGASQGLGAGHEPKVLNPQGTHTELPEHVITEATQHLATWSRRTIDPEQVAALAVGSLPSELSAAVDSLTARAPSEVRSPLGLLKTVLAGNIGARDDF